MAEKYDVVIAGGGHNSLIVDCYLAKAGVSTCIVERRPEAGEFYSDLERTCESMARISPRDAQNYRRRIEFVSKTLDMIVMGMFSVPPGGGVQAAMLDQSPEGQEMMRLQAISAWDLICEWIEHPKIRIALARYASEAMMNPFDNGTAFGFYIILPYMYKFGWVLPSAVRARSPARWFGASRTMAGRSSWTAR